MQKPLIQQPGDLRRLSLEDLLEIAGDIRQLIISTCLKNGGHLGGSLGAVELTLALHFIFNSPEEPIIWDVGHQAYAHKIVSGRWTQFATLRQNQGISGFLQRTESPHDVFGAGHSSTSLSAALAIAWSQNRKKNSPLDPLSWTIAVIGDGGLTAGLAYEALNNLKAKPLGPFLVVLNDNQMSISGNVGVLPAILCSSEAPEFFKGFGFDYIGPVDGHDLHSLIQTLGQIKLSRSTKPILLHVLTQKGKGYIPAEEYPEAFHGISPLPSKVVSPPVPAKTYSETFGETLCELAGQDERIVAITAAMPEGTGLTRFAKLFPDRFFDVGIAEAHAVTFAAGLATQGYKPVVAIYSTFLQRALDSIIHDVALQNLGVIFAIDRAGIVGQDGPTHHGVFDLAYLGMIPNLIVTAPACLEDLRVLLKAALASETPWAIRYPRGSAVVDFKEHLVDNMRQLQKALNPKVIIVALGSSASRVLRAAREVDSQSQGVSVISTLSAKPFAPSLISALDLHPHAQLMVVEDGVIRSGFGESLAQMLSPRKSQIQVIGYGDHFISHGTPAELEHYEGLSQAALVEKIKNALK